MSIRSLEQFSQRQFIMINHPEMTPWLSWICFLGSTAKLVLHSLHFACIYQRNDWPYWAPCSFFLFFMSQSCDCHGDDVIGRSATRPYSVDVIVRGMGRGTGTGRGRGRGMGGEEGSKFFFLPRPLFLPSPNPPPPRPCDGPPLPSSIVRLSLKWRY